MPCPFPGMDPWLERPGLWRDVHTNLIAALAGDLNPRLRPRYRAAIEQNMYIAAVEPPDVVGSPDLAIHPTPSAALPISAAGSSVAVAEPVVVELPYQVEVTHRWLEVRTVPEGLVIAVIEILSPFNKRPREGRQEYERKRNRVLASMAHLVEIDLLRAGEPLAYRWPGDSYASAYRILVSHADHRPRADPYPFNVRDPIPPFPLPLREGDEMPIVDLGALLHDLYDRASYDLVLNYAAPPEPPLSEDDAAWAEQAVRIP